MVNPFEYEERLLNVRIREEVLARRELQLEKNFEISSEELEKMLGSPEIQIGDNADLLTDASLIEYELALAHREAVIEQLMSSASLTDERPQPNPSELSVVAYLSSRILAVKAWHGE